MYVPDIRVLARLLDRFRFKEVVPLQFLLKEGPEYVRLFDELFVDGSGGYFVLNQVFTSLDLLLQLGVFLVVRVLLQTDHLVGEPLLD